MKASDTRKGNVVEHEGGIHQVRDIQRSKPARLDTGVEIQLPEYTGNNEKFRVNTLTGESAGRA